MLRKYGLTVLVLLLACAFFVTNEARAAIPTDLPPGTFPLTWGERGVRVADAQYLMRGHNVFGMRTLYHAPTGYYDTATMRATRRAKYRLGYPLRAVDGRFGRTLRRFLTGEVKLPPLFVKRRAQRTTFTLTRSYPVDRRGALIGFPFQGTHRLGNYQSDNAVDISCRPGAKILAPIAGRLFGGYGQLGSRGSRFLGKRINMRGSYKGKSVAFYLAHMSRLAVRPYAKVRAGQVVGYCGPANGVYHLHIGSSYRFPIVDFVLGRH